MLFIPKTSDRGLRAGHAVSHMSEDIGGIRGKAYLPGHDLDKNRTMVRMTRPTCLYSYTHFQVRTGVDSIHLPNLSFLTLCTCRQGRVEALGPVRLTE